ncbi:response regulator receiver protein [Actinomadura rayongensis]|uniref:Response regulator receiver protein n=1 Tax=Actinomadura rayongensis TaxID=1429076 RepID=A0A6I4VYA7_9ACTN|nr:response regulator receiver protein [Actinomadura rayongensis]MXQ62937.1 response regulator receiver protein [Actinomadura rayongensis]
MSSGVEADIVLDAAVVLTLGMNRVLGRGGEAAGRGAQLLAALAAGRAEARAEALAEAETYERAVREVLARNARAEELARTRAELDADVPLPEPLTPGDETAAELTAWCAATDRALDAAEAHLAGALAARVGQQVFALPDRVAVPERPAAPDARDALERVLTRLLPDASDHDRDAVAAAARLLAAATTAEDADTALTEVRLRVRDANARTRDRRADEKRRAQEAEAAEQAAAERGYVLDAITTAFEELGYEVHDGFETLTANDGALLLTRGDWPDHSVKMRIEDAGRVRAAMVRGRAARSADDRRLDAEREEEWCAAFERARTRLAASGVTSEVTWRLDPGVHELPVSDPARQTGTRSGRRARGRERRGL